MSAPVRLLIVGTGGMAQHHVAKYRKIPGVSIVAGVDPREAERDAFCRKHRIPQQFASVEEAIAWGGFDAASNVTPDAIHCRTTLPLLAAGKHVLCEKPLAANEGDARLMTEAAAKAGVVNMVNLSYRDVSAVQAAAQMVREGVIGEVRHLEASYLQSWLAQPAWGAWNEHDQWLWRLSTAHGSKGVLGDVGIHILDFATYVAGLPVAEVSARLATFDKAPGGRIRDYVLDANDSATMQVVLANGALGTVAATRYASGHLNDLRLRLYGTQGGLEVSFENRRSKLRAALAPLETPKWQLVRTPPVPTNYQRFVAAIRGEGPADPDFARGLALQAVLDRAEQSAHEAGRSLAI